MARAPGGGDTVTVDIELDDQPRDIDVPGELRDIMDRGKALVRLFDSLSYGNKKCLVVPIASAKTSATRQRNLDKALDLSAQRRTQGRKEQVAAAARTQSDANLDVDFGVGWPSDSAQGAKDNGSHE